MMNFADELKNWWWYNKRFVLIGLVLLIICVYMFAQSAEEPEPDYFVALVSTASRSSGELAALEERLCAAGLDLNGDGKVLAELKNYGVDLNGGGYSTAESEIMLALDSDIVAGISGIFLLDDPEAFQEKTGGILTQPIIELEPGLYMGLRFDAQDAYKNLFDNLTSEPAV